MTIGCQENRIASKPAALSTFAVPNTSGRPVRPVDGICATGLDEVRRLVCGRCKLAQPCSRECQVARWDAYKEKCDPAALDTPVLVVSGSAESGSWRSGPAPRRQFSAPDPQSNPDSVRRRTCCRARLFCRRSTALRGRPCVRRDGVDLGAHGAGGI
ncbi:hypothetical protein DFJ74DRAFT_667754 [Hyaloraphidium curvatum]|nr:hypothetical protein DFJ74DRAFT_667754 [Hyaloraphidium curvatum]